MFLRQRGVRRIITDRSAAWEHQGRPARSTCWTLAAIDFATPIAYFTQQCPHDAVRIRAAPISSHRPDVLPGSAKHDFGLWVLPLAVGAEACSRFGTPMSGVNRIRDGNAARPAGLDRRTSFRGRCAMCTSGRDRCEVSCMRASFCSPSPNALPKSTGRTSPPARPLPSPPRTPAPDVTRL